MAKRAAIFIVLLALSSCSLIDDDLSVCDEQLTVNYQLQLHTDLSVQLQTELAAEREEPVRRALEQWLEPVFADTAVDVDLRFYSTEQDEMVVHRQEQLSGSRTSFTVTLPKKNYALIALANMQSNPGMQMSGGEHSVTMELNVDRSEELSALQSGIYAAREAIEVNDSTDQIDVSLYMITSAMAIVIETSACEDVCSVSGYMSGSAGGFVVWDSVYTFVPSPLIRLEQIPLSESEASRMPQARRSDAAPYICMTGVCLPTQGNTPWGVSLTVTLTDDRHTTTTLTIGDPLAPGRLQIIKLQLQANGEVVPVGDAEMGATVEMDWNEGSDHELEI